MDVLSTEPLLKYRGYRGVIRRHNKKDGVPAVLLSVPISLNRLDTVCHVSYESVDLALVRLSVLEVIERDLREKRI